MSIRINIGCATCAPENWLNIDGSWTVYLSRVPGLKPLLRRLPVVIFPKSVRRANVTRGLPVPPGSAEAVYASHVMEHLALKEMRIALRHIHKALMPGGVLRVVMPDLRKITERYLASDLEQPAIWMMRALCVGRENGNIYEILLDMMGHRHRWLWDFNSFARELSDAGFIQIRRAEYGDRLDPDFAAVERAESWTLAFGVDCVRCG